MPNSKEELAKGLCLKNSAIANIEQARTLLNSAREKMCNLEGKGYCAKYDKLEKLDGQLALFNRQLRNMPAPTGVFHI